MKVLLVEDDTAFAKDCIEQLLRNHYYASFASDAVSARRKIAEENYDLIIIDLMLPPSFGVEGLDFLKYLKLEQKDIPAIMITSKAFKTTNTVSEAMKLGAADFIDKDETLFMERLLTAIREICSPSSSISARKKMTVRPLFAYVITFIVVCLFCLLLAYILRDFTLVNVIVLSAFILLCLISLAFIVASGFLETGKIDKHQWYKIIVDKVLTSPLALINLLLRRKPTKKEKESVNN